MFTPGFAAFCRVSRAGVHVFFRPARQNECGVEKEKGNVLTTRDRIMGALCTRFGCFSRFILAAGLVFAFAIAAVVALPGPIAGKLLQDDMIARARIWETGLKNVLTDGHRTFVDGTLAPTDEFALKLFLDSSDIYRLKMFDAAGRVFYSSRPGEIGSVTNKPYFRDVVATGRFYFKQDLKNASEIDGLAAGAGGGEERLVAEIYVPVMVDGQFAGAVEFYRDITEIYGLFQQRVKMALGALAAAGVVLSLGAVGAILFAGQRRLKHMRDRAEKEQRLMAEQVRLTREVRLLSELNEWLQSSRSLEELFDMVSAFMSRLLVDCAGSIYVYSNSRDVLDGACSWNGGELHDHIRPESCWGLRRGRTYAFGTSEIDFVCEHVDGEVHQGQPYFCFPVLAHGETVGLMHLMPIHGISDEAFQNMRRLAQMCAEQISLAIANVRMRDQLHHQSVRDPLTGLFNRRYFLETLRKHLEGAKSRHEALSILSIDVDHFKKFNDNHGHDAGDMVLRAVGSTLEHQCDGDETPCRFGGEEFVVMLPGTDAAAAAQRAEAIRAAVERSRCATAKRPCRGSRFPPGWPPTRRMARCRRICSRPPTMRCMTPRRTGAIRSVWPAAKARRPRPR